MFDKYILKLYNFIDKVLYKYTFCYCQMILYCIKVK